MNTGHVVPESVSIPSSGATVTSWSVTVVFICATWSPSTGATVRFASASSPSTSAAEGVSTTGVALSSPVKLNGAARTASAFACAITPSADESHICGCGAVNTASPAESRASNPPPAPTTSKSPLVASGNSSSASAGFAAACGESTRSTSPNPAVSSSTVTIRSTPGSTSS